MITQGWENARVGEEVSELAHRFSEHVQIVVAGLIPDVVRRQIARPYNEINVLGSKRSVTGKEKSKRLPLWVPDGSWQCDATYSR